jgi:alpha-L-fucosidase
MQKPMRANLYLIAAFVLLTSLFLHAADHPVPAVQDTETKAQRDARMAWWREARFGMFIHWGIYSVPAGVWQGKPVGNAGEWIMNTGKIPVADYQALPKQFDPTKFDADAWVAVAKAAGMKYIVITAKHHDGFAMFKSDANPFNIVDATPFHRDPLKELAAACQKQGIKLGFYYSQDQDWTAPGAAAIGGHWDKAQDGDFATYLKTKAIPQMEELLSNYQPFPAVIWFDTPTQEMTPELASQIVTLLNQHPQLIWNNRLGGGYSGDTETPEQHIPPQGYPGRDWETCMTINDTWGYKSGDTNFKSTETLLHNLIDIASKGGNYLLNVGPDATGTIPQPEVDRLEEIGKWLDVNGEAIYGTTASPFRHQLAWGRATQAPGKLYLHVFNWPRDGKLTVPLTNSVTKAYLLTQPQNSLATSTDADGVEVQVPATAPDPMASVVVLEISGAPAPLTAIAQDNKGGVTLKADTAEIKGDTLGLEGDDVPNLGYWTNANDFAHWNISITKPGTFTVTMDYALDPSCAGSTVTLTVGDQKLNVTPVVTGGWGNYQQVGIGSLTLMEAGPYDLKLTGASHGKEAVINLRDITLAPQ